MRAIDADAFDERVRVAGGMSEEELTEDFKDGVQAVLYMLSNQPTIQPEIIHCKDCRKHNKKLGFDGEECQRGMNTIISLAVWGRRER